MNLGSLTPCFTQGVVDFRFSCSSDLAWAFQKEGPEAVFNVTTLLGMHAQVAGMRYSESEAGRKVSQQKDTS